MQRSIRDRISGPRGAILALLTAAIVAGGWIVAACAAQPEGGGESGSEVVAEVMGETITRAELEDAASAQLEQVDAQLAACQKQAEQSRYQALEANLGQMIEQRMLDAEAEERGITREELVASEIDSKVTEVTDADVDAWYEQNRARAGNRPKEQIAPQIKQFLAQQRSQEARSSFMQTLEAKYSTRMLLEPPRVEVAATGPQKGPDDAPVTIVEFSDFECPFCSRVNPTLDQVMENYGDKVRIVFRQYPLPMHSNAQKAAEASLCAHEQGKFWEMHDLMFGDQKGLGVAQLKAKASQLELDPEEFNQCLDSGEYADEVAADLEAGSEVGVTGTPAMFVNGIAISGAVPYEQMSSLIDDELERKGIAD